MVNFVKEKSIKLTKKMLSKMVNIFEDEQGEYFYGVINDKNIECEHNLEVLEDNESRLKKTFKNHPNWSNMRKSMKPVGNHLRFMFCKIEEKKTHKGHTIAFGNYTCKKYYIPDCIKLDT